MSNQNKKADSSSPLSAKPSFSANALTQNIDKSNDGKFSTSEAVKNFAKGLISPITGLFSSPKNFAIGVAMIGGSIALIAATGGAAAPILVAAGVGMGAIQAGKGIVGIATAKNGDDAEKAFYDIGGATSTIGLSVAGAKTSLKQANIDTKGLNILGSIKKCVTSTKDLSIECLNVFKSGHYKTNLSNAIKVATQPKSLRKFAKESFDDGEKHFDESFDAVKKVFPENERTTIKGRNKSEISRYEKIVKERTVEIKKAIEETQNNPKFSNKTKKEIINELLAEKDRIATDGDFAKSKVEDGYGARKIIQNVNKKSIKKTVSSLVEAVKRGDIEILELENYGKKGACYFGENEVNALRNVSPKMTVSSSSKSSGYTAVHLKVKPKNGRLMELQIRGREIDITADWEHITYDLRQGKDISKGNNKAGILLSETQKSINKLTPEQQVLYQRYIRENYDYARLIESGKKATAPQLPRGVSESLSARNLYDLHAKLNDFNPGSIKNPFEMQSQLGFIANLESEAKKQM